MMELRLALFSKSRVAHVELMTIPQLELAVARLAVRICCPLESEVKIKFDKIYLWMDSFA